MYSLNAMITIPEIRKSILDHIDKEIIDNPNHQTFGPITESINEHLAKTTSIDSISRSTIQRLFREEGIIKDKQKKCFVYLKDYEKEVNQKWFIKLIQSNISSVFSYTQPTSLEGNFYTTLVLSVKPGKEHLICELITEYFELDKDYHIMMGKHCITISAVTHPHISEMNIIQHLERKISQLLDINIRSLD